MEHENEDELSNQAEVIHLRVLDENLPTSLLGCSLLPVSYSKEEHRNHPYSGSISSLEKNL